MGRLRRKSEDEFEFYAQIIADCVSRNCKGITDFNVQRFKEQVIEELKYLVRAFSGKIVDTD